MKEELFFEERGEVMGTLQTFSTVILPWDNEINKV